VGLLWQDYAQGKQSQKQIGHLVGKSREWVNRHLAKDKPVSKGLNKSLTSGTVVIIADTTYFQQFGLMVFRSPDLRQNLLWYEIGHETNELYSRGIQELLDEGWKISAIVADGKPGLGRLFPDIPFQLCQFHQFATITRYISKKPKLIPSQELRQLMFLLKQMDLTSFTYWLEQWHEKWKDFLNEQTINPLTNKKTYTHQKLRKAYHSLKRNLPLLFTFETKLPETIVPNTTNSLDGYFGHLKGKLNVHRGASKETQLKLIERLIFG